LKKFALRVRCLADLWTFCVLQFKAVFNAKSSDGAKIEQQKQTQPSRDAEGANAAGKAASTKATRRLVYRTSPHDQLTTLDVSNGEIATSGIFAQGRTSGTFAIKRKTDNLAVTNNSISETKRNDDVAEQGAKRRRHDLRALPAANSAAVAQITRVQETVINVDDKQQKAPLSAADIAIAATQVKAKLRTDINTVAASLRVDANCSARAHTYNRASVDALRVAALRWCAGARRLADNVSSFARK
jgi:hypothetical protein